MLRMKNGGFRPTSLAVKLSIIELISWGTLFYTFSAVLPLLKQSLEWGKASVSGGISFALVVVAFCSPVVGRMIDRDGARAVMSGGTIIGGAGLFLCSYPVHPLVFYSGWFFVGISGACLFYTPAFSTVVRYQKEGVQQSILLISLVAGLASTVFIPFAGTIATFWGWEIAFRVQASVLILIGFPLAQSLPKTSTVQIQKGEDVSSNEKIGTGRATSLTAIFMIGDAVSVSVNAFLVVFLVQSEISLEKAIWISGSLGISKVFGRISSAVLFPGQPLVFLRVILTMSAVALGLPLFFQSQLSLVLMTILFGFCDGIRTILRPKILQMMPNSAQFGTRNGKIQLFCSIGEAAAPFVFSGLVVLVGWSVSWAALIALLVSGVVTLSVNPVEENPMAIVSASNKGI